MREHCSSDEQAAGGAAAEIRDGGRIRLRARRATFMMMAVLADIIYLAVDTAMTLVWIDRIKGVRFSPWGESRSFGTIRNIPYPYVRLANDLII